MLTDTSSSPSAAMTSLPPRSAAITGGGPLARLRDQAIAVTIPTMGEIMFDADVAHAYENFLVAAGEVEGTHVGPPFMDGDFYKWLEAAVIVDGEAGGESPFSEWIGKAAAAIAAAQQPDGYVHTKTTISERSGGDLRPLRQRTDFETYNFGHLMTLACVHHRMTGDDAYLRLATNVAGYLRTVADESPETLADCNICPSHYMGLVEVYRSTGDKRHLELAGRLLDLHGGKGRAGSDDNQDVLPVREQRRAAGHAVRANYLYAGMADYVLETGDEAMRTALESIWADLVGSKLYVTGGCGALYDGASPDAAQDYWSVTRVHQAYGRPYQLPQTTAYNESCASLGLVMWAWRMLAISGDAKYADEIERVLYNALPAMIGLDGKTYFYTNPLRQVRALPFALRRAGNPTDSTPPPSEARVRQEFMTACFCCPPNVARFIAELPYLVASQGPRALWVHQYVAGTVTARLDGVDVTVEQTTAYPAEGTVRLDVRAASPVSGAIRVRIPGWAPGARVTVDSEPVDVVEQGYAVIDQTWSSNTIVVELPIAPRLVVAHHFVEEATNQVAVMRGPVVYCVESADLPEDTGIETVYLPRSIAFTERPGTGQFAGHVLLDGTAATLPAPVPDGQLFADLDDAEPRPLDVTLVPYAVWGNRGPGEMSVWIPLLH
ncbi:hypothetical protein E1262_25850 [Jiangella aurantiaca]|uniref:Glycoside hydrolase family 127 protein n=1 Tax=Jiangella aurantiaca TaxID=2530373 RepID=A0A4R5A3S7_9ACTN|nr:beta-L-arabinofuranosidase domain-containing protein [Jiangella aurantiaca]TDD65289.1 hypothetical protein E1262_25850 [Jiangella aurantiaca]